MFLKSSSLPRAKGSRNGQFGGVFSSQNSQKGNVRHRKLNMLNESDSALSKSVALNTTIGVQVELLLFWFGLVFSLSFCFVFVVVSFTNKHSGSHLQIQVNWRAMNSYRAQREFRESQSILWFRSINFSLDSLHQMLVALQVSINLQNISSVPRHQRYLIWRWCSVYWVANLLSFLKS